MCSHQYPVAKITIAAASPAGTPASLRLTAGRKCTSGVIGGDGDDDRHDERVADQVRAAERVDGRVEDDEQRDGRQPADQRRPEQAESHRELGDAGHRNEDVARQAEGQEGLFLDQRIEPVGIGELFQARPHQRDGDTPAAAGPRSASRGCPPASALLVQR
jgi:hypothetical protein